MARKKKQNVWTGKGRKPRVAGAADPAVDAVAETVGLTTWSISRRTAAIVLGVLCAAAFLSRVVPALDQIFPDSGQIRLLGVDPFYHLRHATFAADHFPDLMRWDIGTHYPTGQRAHTASLFDLSIASVAYVIGLGDPSERLVTYVAVWTPAVLGTLSFALVYLLAQSVFSRLAALTATAVYVMYPGTSLHRTLLGFADHHVAEIALGLLTTWGLIRCLQACDLAGPGWPPLLRIVGYALPPALLVFTWAGGAIYLLIILVILCAVCAVEIAHSPESMATARASLLYGGVLLPMIGLPGIVWPDLVMAEVRFPLTVLGCLVIAVVPAAYAYLARTVVRKVGNARLVAMGSSAVVAVGGIIFVWQHPIANSMMSFLLQTKIQTLAEHRDVDWPLYWKLLGAGGILAVVGMPLALARSIRSVESRRGLVAVMMGMTWIGLWMSSHDYDYVPPAFVGLLTGFTIDAIVTRALAFRTRVIPVLAVGFITAGLVAPIWPLQNVIMPWATHSVVKEHVVINEGWEQAMEWLRNETPKPTIAIDEPVEPWAEGGGGFRYPAGTYGVFSAWDFGNMVAVLGKRAPVWSQWTSKKGAEWLLCEDEAKSRELLCPECEDGEEIRYVVIEARTIANHIPGKILNTGRRLEDYDSQKLDWYTISEEEKILRRTFGARYRNAMSVRLYVDDARNLGHYRLVYASPHESYIPYLLEYGTFKFKRVAFNIGSPAQREEYSKRSGIARVGKTATHWEYDGIITGTVKIFEHVNGARLQGTAVAGSTIEAQLPLHCGPEGRLVEYSRSVQAAEDGRFELVVAHATTPKTGAWSCSSKVPYEITLKPPRGRNVVRSIHAIVEESQVCDGETIDLGRLN